MTIRSSTIFISIGEQTRVYHSMDEVPAAMRQRLEETTNGVNASTILIADRNGRDELMKALQGKSNHLQFRVTPTQTLPVSKSPGLRPFWEKNATWLEIAGVGLLGAAIWSLFLWK